MTRVLVGFQSGSESLRYNYSIVNVPSSKTPTSNYPTQGSLRKICPTYYFSKKGGDNKNTSLFKLCSSFKELPPPPPKKKIKKSNRVKKG
jgi:hypothetical protein